MRGQHLRTCVTSLAAVVLLGLALAACATTPADDARPTPTPDTSAPGPTGTAAAGPATTSSPAPTPSAPVESQPPELPAEYASRMPSEEDLDRMVLEAQEAYRAHRAAYDAAARTGFTDPDLVEAAMAGAGGDMLDLLSREAAGLAEAGQVVEGGTEVLGMEVAWLSPPGEDGLGLQVVLDACVLVSGVLKDPDGTVARDLTATEPLYVQPRLVHHDGGWVLHNQLQQEGPCPDHVAGRSSAG